jgi:hypothetical protein
MMFFDEEEIKNFFNEAYENNIDIALAEPTIKKYNNHSKVLNANHSGFKAYSHPYALFLQEAGYNIIYDSNMLGLGYLKYPEHSPYYLTFVYASKKENNSFIDSHKNDLNTMMK